jgi:hypothetical protein
MFRQAQQCPAGPLGRVDRGRDGEAGASLDQNADATHSRLLTGEDLACSSRAGSSASRRRNALVHERRRDYCSARPGRHSSGSAILVGTTSSNLSDGTRRY